MTPVITDIDALRRGLEAYITAESGATVEITDMKPLAGGASRESWAISLTLDGEPQRLVMRMDTPTTMNSQALTRAQEYVLMDTAHKSGVRVARMRFLCDDPDVLGQPFFLMDFVEGISIGRKVIKEPALEHARSVLPEQMAEQLAIIHRMPVDGLNFLARPEDGDTPEDDVVQATLAILDDLGVDAPAFEFGLRWADQHKPARSETTFVHGDFRIGNLLIDENGLAAVIDWEFGHLGNPVEEIGYLCMRDWRFGNDHLHAAGLCPRERFIRAYEEHSGRDVDRAAVDWWEIMGNIRWGVICLAQAQRHLSGEEPSVELASLGRRSAEMQLETLRLIEKAGL